ncbi:MAG: TIGR00300 family protein [Deltaproteobacteria bacterium]|nr:TIGR00300 family protein [Deltaproteobacteria bacterium]
MENHSETVVLKGHIIDSLTLSKVLDEIQRLGGDYITEEVTVGKTRKDSSTAVIKVMAEDDLSLELILKRLHVLGADIQKISEIQIQQSMMNGVFPERFYSTTNYDTEVQFRGKWIAVKNTCMDSGIRIDQKNMKATCVKMIDVKKGEDYVIGFNGIRIKTAEVKQQQQAFTFMNSGVSSEKPKNIQIKKLAAQLKDLKKDDKGKVVFVCGPAVVHTGASESLCRIIDLGYIDCLFAGNALAAHDIESALFETSLGVSLRDGKNSSHGHMNHLYAINKIRSLGGIHPAVEKGVLKKGIMYSLVKNRRDFLLAGSIRDDGPLPDVITDSLRAQKMMRQKLKGVKMAILLSTMLHSIAVGNLLPASVMTVCVDISPEVVTKLADRGSHQTLGLVMDVEAFLSKLADYL